MASQGKPIKVTVVDRRHHADPEASATEERSPYPSFVEELRRRAEAAEARARDAAIRSEAEIVAVRERLQRDVERRVIQGSSRLLCAMLEVVDNLERALAAASASEAPAVARGIELVHQQMMSILRSEGVEPIETLGRPYDPGVAEAMVVETVERERDNLVLEELQRGYLMGEVVLRPARVKVGKESPS